VPPDETPGAPSSPEPTTGPQPEPQPGIDGVRGTPGALPVGAAQYEVPAGAIVVDPGGSDSNAGPVELPLGTLGAAITRAPSGSTIVLREGDYHGAFVIPQGRDLTIQPYPGEEVWLDGSRVVENWQPDGDAWVAPDWTVQFDASPTYSRGAPDGTATGWQFVNPAYPMAAHPDQVWIDDVAQRQVGSRELLVPGAFFVDYATARLYLGSDPTGQVVHASDTVKALVIAGAGSTVRGIGIKRYSPSVPDIGAVAVSAANVTVENVEITESATTGLAIFAPGARLVDLTISRSGMLGAQASTADRLSARGLLLTENNTEHFNRAPVAGGFKIHKSRGVSVIDSAFTHNAGNSLWFDESVYDMTVTGNDIIDGTGNGIVVELSSKAVIADNVVLRNGRDGILISDSGHVEVWNNTIAGSFRSINITQGTRRASNLALPGHDPRQKLPDPTVTWITEDITVSNNVFADSTGKCVLCVEDYSHERSADQMRVRSNGNLFHRTSTTQPNWAVVWSRGHGNPAVYTSVAAFARATGQDADSAAMDGTPALNGSVLSPAAESMIGPVARPLDARLAALVGQPERTRHVGAWP
jgi:parallel beta-helix repeat protein